MSPLGATTGGTLAVPWARLQRWSAGAFLLGGVGLLLSFVLLGPDLTVGEPLPTRVVSVLVFLSLFLVFVVGLIGFYPQVSHLSPMLAVGGAVASGIGGASVTPSVVLSIVADTSQTLPLARTLVFDLSLPLAVILDTLGAQGFGDQSRVFILFFFYPPSALLFLASLSLLLSFLLYGLASVRTRSPSLGVGVVLLVPVVVAVGKTAVTWFEVDIGLPSIVGSPAVLVLSLLAIGVLLQIRRPVKPAEQTTLDDFRPEE